MQRVALPVHLHGHRVHQERHVVIDDLDDGVRARPAVLLGARVVHAQLRHAGSEHARERQVRHGGAVKILGRPVGEILGIDVVVVLRDEGARLLGGRRLLALVGDSQYLLEERLLLLVGWEMHGGALPDETVIVLQSAPGVS